MAILGIFRTTGRDPGRATLIARGVALVAVVVVVTGTLYLVGRGTFVDSVEASIVLDDAGGSLAPGADVKLDGVIVGKVTGLRHDDPGALDTGVALAVSLDPDLAESVPSDVRARVLPASIFGTSFVDLVSAGRGERGISAGQVIAQDTSRETLEVQNVLDGLDRVVGALGPARLSRALEGLSGALDGNGEELGETIVRLDTYLTKLNPQMGLVRRNLDLLATNLEAFERYAPDLFSATEKALVAARTLTEREQDFSGLVVSGSRTFDDTEELLRRNRRVLADTLVRTAVVVDALYDGRRGVVDGLLAAFRLGARFNEGLSQGPYLRIRGDLVLRHRDAYDRGDCPRYGPYAGRSC